MLVAVHTMNTALKLAREFLFCVVVVGSLRTASTLNCHLEPEDLKMESIMRRGHQFLKDVPKRFIEKRKIPIPSNHTCPSRHDITHGVVLGTTPCPTVAEIDYDKNRIPKKILQRRCKCLDCLPVFDHVVRRAVSRCLPVFQYQMVLRRVDCDGQTFVYRPVMEPFVVSCSCQIDFAFNIW